MSNLRPAVRRGLLESHKVLTALLGLGLASCAALPNSDPLQVNVAGVEPLQGEGLELRFAVQVRVQNPNDAAIEYDGVALTLDLNGREFGSGVSSEVGTVPRYGETVLTIPVTVGMLNIARQVLGFVNEGDTPQAVTYKVKGKLEGGMFGTRRFEKEGTLDLPQGQAPN